MEHTTTTSQRLERLATVARMAAFAAEARRVLDHMEERARCPVGQNAMDELIDGLHRPNARFGMTDALPDVLELLATEAEALAEQSAHDELRAFERDMGGETMNEEELEQRKRLVG